MGNELTVPHVEVVENGRPVPQERLDPNVATFIMQAAATAQLVKLRKLEESKIPGRLVPVSKTITNTTFKLTLYPPWISFSLINDGAGALTIWINDETDPLVTGMIASGETYSCNMEYPVIKTIYLKANTGTTAAVRIYGKEGRNVV